MHTAMCNSVHLKNGSQTVQTAANQEVKVGNPPGPGKVVSSPRAEGLEASHRLRCRTAKPPEGKGFQGFQRRQRGSSDAFWMAKQNRQSNFKLDCWLQASAQDFSRAVKLAAYHV